MSNKSIATIATIGTDIGKNSFHVFGLDFGSFRTMRGAPAALDIPHPHDTRHYSPNCNSRVMFVRCSRS